MKCKDCGFWVCELRGRGLCRNEHFVDTKGLGGDEIPLDGLGYWDYDGHGAGFATGEDFGCIHFEEREP